MYEYTHKESYTNVHKVRGIKAAQVVIWVKGLAPMSCQDLDLPAQSYLKIVRPLQNSHASDSIIVSNFNYSNYNLAFYARDLLPQMLTESLSFPPLFHLPFPSFPFPSELSTLSQCLLVIKHPTLKRPGFVAKF